MSKTKPGNPLGSSKIMILTFAIAVLIAWQFIILNPLKQTDSEPYSQIIKDACGRTVNGEVMHTITTGKRCEIECRNLCESIEKEIDKSIFIMAEQGCHNCECFCK